MIQPERIQRLSPHEPRRGRFVLYWMQASQRAECNHALEYAVEQANAFGQPLVTLFGLTDDYPEANLRHYAFMLEGLRESEAALRERGIQLVVRRQAPDEAAIEMGRDASMLVTDRGYLRHQRQWRGRVARQLPCPVHQVETDAVVPLEAASGKEEYAAATLRPKIHRVLDAFLAPLREREVRRDSLGLKLETLDLSDLDVMLTALRVDRTAPRQGLYVGGTSRAKAWLDAFLAEKLPRYAEGRNDPSLGIWSNLSPYLHFGQISPLYTALRVRESAAPQAAKDAFLEELIVRRELAMNFVFHNPRYDSFRCLPDWARATLEKHRGDRREYVYTAGQLEAAATHDPYWNAAMREMALTGKTASYMRMYWGKKLLEWSRTPQHAFRTALRLNNRYFLDGRDANSYAAVAWCFGKHDRPWGERPVFGTVRYMSAGGLERKFDIAAYVRQVEALEAEAARGPAT